MRRAWVVLLASCGFQSKAPASNPTVDAPSSDASSSDASSTDGTVLGSTCWTISDADNNAHWSACTTALAPSIDVTGAVSIDTDGGGSTPAGYACAPLTAGSVPVCALAASSITIEAGAILSAHGTKPLALLGHTIDIEGKIDVASHVHGQRGAGAIDDCNPSMTPAKKAGGGAGGTYAGFGGKGGDQGGGPNMGSGGAAGSSESSSELRGGCDGRRGGDGTSTGGPNGVGGAGGGSVWISSDVGMLTLGHDAVINASGASGTGGVSDNRGGHGGGSGGMIVLQSSTITHDANAQIFANGGHGGGGGGGGNPGGDGVDPTAPMGPMSGGTGGQGAVSPPKGNGGSGFPSSTMIDGADGEGGQQAGGGGGGGGDGVIRLASTTVIGGPNVSPPAVNWTP